MDLQVELRQGLHKMIDQIKDVSILQAVYVILEREKKHEEGGEDFYDTLHPLLQASIERGLEQIKKGETVPHEEVRKRYEKWVK
jgi:predicted transcriptional regulator